MRPHALVLAAFVALPTLGLAQTRGISTNPPSAVPPRPSDHPHDGDRLHDGDRPHDGDRRHDGGHRSRPVVIVLSPYGDAYVPDGSYDRGSIVRGYDTHAFGSASTTTYTGSYAPGASHVAFPVGADTTYVRYVPTPPANAPEMPSPAAVTSLAAERIGGSMLRLRWTGHEPRVREVTFVVADAARRVLATQTVRAAPWSAVFDNGTRIAFLGTTVVHTDGVSTPTLVPIARVRGATVRKPLPAIRRTGQ